jgi:hypothetical protein
MRPGALRVPDRRNEASREVLGKRVIRGKQRAKDSGSPPIASARRRAAIDERGRVEM